MAGFFEVECESMKLEKTGVFAETWPPEWENWEAAECATVGECLAGEYCSSRILPGSHFRGCLTPVQREECPLLFTDHKHFVHGM
jgi:hypothetical protein